MQIQTIIFFNFYSQLKLIQKYDFVLIIEDKNNKITIYSSKSILELIDSLLYSLEFNESSYSNDILISTTSNSIIFEYFYKIVIFEFNNKNKLIEILKKIEKEIVYAEL